MAASGELVGLRLIIEKPTQTPAAVVTKSAVKLPATNGGASRVEMEAKFVGLELLKSCSCCRKKLGARMDVFMYKGEQAFCSTECREQQILKDERIEMEILASERSKLRQRTVSAKHRGTDRHWRIQAAA